MINRFNLLIVNDKSGRLERLCGRVTEFHSVGSFHTLPSIGVYTPNVVVAEVTSADDGISLSDSLASQGFFGVPVFYGERETLIELATSVKRGVCVYIDSAMSDDGVLDRLLIAKGYLSELNKYRLVMNSVQMGATQIKRGYFAALFTGGEDDYLRMQLEAIGIKIPLRGCVIYGRTLAVGCSCADDCYHRLTRILREQETFGEWWHDRFVMITSNDDAAAIRAAVLEYASETDRDKLVVGISVFSDFDVKSAVKNVKTLVGNGVFWSASGVYTDEDNLRVESNKHRRLVNDTLKLISEHYDEKISASWAAKQLFVSPSHLMHEFKKAFGYTFNDCLKKYRIMRSKDLLATGRFRVNEVARAVGFSDARYFCNVFKSETGISPGEFIKRAHGED